MAAKKISARFYSSDGGSEPVKEWLMDLSKEDRKRIGTDIKSVEFAWPIGMPTVRAMKKKLWEIRTDLDNGRIARVFFTIRGKELILLHGIIKKSQKTPKQDLDLARERARFV